MDKRESLKWQSRNLRPKEVAESAIVMDVDVGRSISAMSFYKDYVLNKPLFKLIVVELVNRQRLLLTCPSTTRIDSVVGHRQSYSGDNSVVLAQNQT